MGLRGHGSNFVSYWEADKLVGDARYPRNVNHAACLQEVDIQQIDMLQEGIGERAPMSVGSSLQGCGR